MRVPKRIWVVVCLVFFAIPLKAQQGPRRDPQALTILTQAVAVGGGPAAISSVKDFTAQGTMTYYWAGEEVIGSATVRCRGVAEFRLDANLPSGMRSWATSGGSASIKDANGKVSPIPYHNAVNLGALSLPYLKIVTALSDATISITYKGAIQFEGKPAHLIRAQQVFPTKADPTGDLSKLNTFDIVVDASSGLILATVDTAHPEYNSTDGVPHEIRFGDYGPANGVIVPHTITELVGGQKTWTLQLTSINFNSGLTDTDFQF
jgi:hypothetical protein